MEESVVLSESACRDGKIKRFWERNNCNFYISTAGTLLLVNYMYGKNTSRDQFRHWYWGV